MVNKFKRRQAAAICARYSKKNQSKAAEAPPIAVLATKMTKATQVFL
jgi:hypothetical protein